MTPGAAVPKGLSGMALLRLGLERAASAREAAEVIGALLEAGFTLYMVTIIEIYSVTPATSGHRGAARGPRAVGLGGAGRGARRRLVQPSWTLKSF